MWKRKVDKVRRIIEVRHRLPVEWRVPDIDHLFYRAGLPVHHADRAEHRKRVPPAVHLLINIFVLVRSLWLLAAPEVLSPEQVLMFYYLGDISILVKLRYHFSFLLITFALATIFLLLYHRYLAGKDNIESMIKRQQIAPIFLLLGRRKAVELNLTSRELLVKLVKRVRTTVKTVEVVRVWLGVSVPLGYGFCLMYKFVKDEVPVFSVVSIVVAVCVYALFSDGFYSIILYHLLYFYICCEYLKLKMVLVVDRFGRYTRRGKRRPHALYEVMLGTHELEANLRDVTDYNRFWSRVILIWFVTFSANLSVFIFVTIFSDIAPIIRALCFAVICLEVIIFGIILHNASKVNTLRAKVYKQLYVLLAHWTRLGPDSKASGMLKLKMSPWVQAYSESSLGFTCGPLFTVNYYVSMEIVVLMLSFFLKLVQIQAEADRRRQQ